MRHPCLVTSIARCAVAIVLVVAVAACTSDSLTRPATACDLVTQGEVSGVVGTAASGPTPVALMQQAPGQTACGFGTNAAVGQVLVTMQRPGLAAFDEARA